MEPMVLWFGFFKYWNRKFSESEIIWKPEPMVLCKIQITAQHWKEPMLGGSLILLITVGSGFAESFIIREPAVQVYSQGKSPEAKSH